MSMGGFAPYPETLPPPDARLHNPATDGLIPTPTHTDTGLIDITSLIETVKSTVDPSYQWPRGLSMHHFYWPGANYASTAEPESRFAPATFRNIPVHRGLVLRTFENWLHTITEPPEIPSPEVRDYRVMAWHVARDLFKTARKTVQWERMAQRRRTLIAENPQIIPAGFNGVDVIGEEIMQEVLERHFRVFELQLTRQDDIPEALRIVDLSGSPKEIAASLGKVVAKPSLRLVRSTAA